MSEHGLVALSLLGDVSLNVALLLFFDRNCQLLFDELLLLDDGLGDPPRLVDLRVVAMFHPAVALATVHSIGALRGLD